MKTLFSNADILTPKNNWNVIRNGYLGITNDTISYIGGTKPIEKYDIEKNLYNCLIIPGLYNMHTHTPMAALRGLGTNLPLDRWLFEAMLPIEQKMIPADKSVGVRLEMMEMLASGVVSFSDMYHYPNHYIEDVIQSGMKANLSFPIMAVMASDLNKNKEIMRLSVEFFDEFNGTADGRIITDFAIHAEYTNNVEIVREYSEICRGKKGRMHIHLSETKKEHEECKKRYGKTPAAWFYDLGTFDNPTIAAHCVMVEPEDILLLKEKDVTVVHNPSSNMKLGSGVMPIRKMKEKGLRITIGTDSSASNNNQNMIEEMALTALIHCGFSQDPTVLSPNEVLTMATLNGAAAQGRSNCGELEVGKKADLAVIDLDKPHLMPIHDYPSLIVYSAQAADVIMTMVDGRTLYEKGEFLSIDKDQVKFDLKKSLERLF
ncbi:MAG TPA: amidohydrolase [Flexilinea sp.]|nr:amidohydrolase [Flexilinea sp.]